MKYRYLIVLVLFFAGCTSDHYTPISGSEGSQNNLKTDLKYCRDTSIHIALANRDNSGALLGGVLGGAIGGAIVGAAISSGKSTQPKIDINKSIEECMADKGYSGHSERYN